VNTPVAPGDRLYAAPGGTVELQIGGRAFVRAAGASTGAEVSLGRLEPAYLQLELMSGTVSLDVRELPPGEAIDVNTPHGVLTLERAGYYRIEVGAEQTAFLAYRGGAATLTAETGARLAVPSDGQAVIADRSSDPTLGRAPAPSEWDRWNLARTDSLLTAASAQYVPPGVYGLSDLDRHGSWRVTAEYGPVWTPAAVPGGWVPYSTGRWIWDPYFEWTWVDDAPWGWAPYHHGRWVHVTGAWAWAPGPFVPYPAYAPALVAFLHPVVVTTAPPISWVALGWGEPCVPWWGRHRFAARPWWGGWGGPRFPRGHRNAEVRHAVVTVPAERFARGPVEDGRMRAVDVKALRPVAGALGIQPTRDSVVPIAEEAAKPTGAARRRVLAARPPQDVSPRLRAAGLAPAAPAGATSPTRLVASRPLERGPAVSASQASGSAVPSRVSTPQGGRKPTPASRPAVDEAPAMPPLSVRPSISARDAAGRRSPLESRPAAGSDSRVRSDRPRVAPAPPERPATLPRGAGAVRPGKAAEPARLAVGDIPPKRTPPMGIEPPRRPERPTASAAGKRAEEPRKHRAERRQAVEPHPRRAP
jgi:hypothetical protein